MIVYDEAAEVTQEQRAMLDRWMAERPLWSFASRVHVFQGELHAGSIFDDFIIREVPMGDAIGVVFTGPDKSLLDRSARAAEAQAKLLGWEALTGQARKKAKLEYDRLMRDAHDLRLMGIRLTKVARALRTPAEKPAAPVLATAPFPGPDQRRLGSGDRRKESVLLHDQIDRRVGIADRRVK